MPRLTRLLPAVVTISFCLVAFVFSILAVTSPEWANRDEFNPLVKAKNWTADNLIYTQHRSPFIICLPVRNDTTVNSTTGGDPITTTTWTVACQQYRPFGLNQTSCELEVVTQYNPTDNLGDQRQCQQIHLAGNFGIVSAAFISTGFLLALVAIPLTFLSSTRAEPQHSADELDPDDPAASHHDHEHHHHHHRQPQHHKGRRTHGSVAPYLNLGLVTCLSIGVIASVISQFYAVEGLIQSALNNADFASSAGSFTDQQHGPWYQGKALSVYATCAWGFAAAGAVMAARTWRLPRWEKLA